MSKVFLKRGSIYTSTDGDFTVSPSLDEGIYQTIQNPMTGEIFLNRIADSFHFGFKLYGLDNKLINHVIDTYNKQETKHNLGVLLNGAKGTGKTVTAKYLANKLGLPVIICDQPYPGLSNFLASINHDCVFFFDEFEKNFRLECGDDKNCAGEDLLSIMDGVYNGDYCHIFLLTTNELKINDNLISRPSRIRYLKSFGEVIDRKILEEYIDDNLTRKEYREEILEFIDTLSMATIDIVKSIVDEINLHNCHIDEFRQFFNVKEASYLYYIRSWYFTVRDDVGMEKFSGTDGVSKERFIKRCKDYSTTEEYEFSPTFDKLVLNKDVRKFKEGQPLYKGSRFIIKNLDLANHYMCLADTRNFGSFRHVYIQNIDTKPSLYDDASNAFYAYMDDEDGISSLF